MLTHFHAAQRNMVYAETKMNKHSSRSHAVLQVKPPVRLRALGLLGTQSGMLDRVTALNRTFLCEREQQSRSAAGGFGLTQVRIGKHIRATKPLHDDKATGAASRGSKVKVTETTGMMSLVDLAGCERIKKSGAQGQQFKEATNINSSLLTLGSVMKALANPHRQHVPFRDSKLTYLLQASTE